MARVVKIIGAADGSTTPHDGKYVVAWNSNVPYGTFECTTSPDKMEARRFNSPDEIFTEWTAVSVIEPMRPDGRPNRPLTGVTLEVEDD